MRSLKYLIKPTTINPLFKRAMKGAVIPINVKPVKLITKEGTPRAGGRAYNPTKFYKKRKKRRYGKERKGKKKKTVR